MKLSGKTLRNILIFLTIATAIYFVVSASKYRGIENFDSSSTKVDINWTLILIIGIPVTLYFIVGLVLLARGGGSAPKRPSAPVANNGNNNNNSVNSGRTSDPGINLGALASKVNLGGLAGSVANLSGMGKTFQRFQQAQKVGSVVGSVGSKASGAVKSVGKGVSSLYSKGKGLFSKSS